MTYKVSSGMLNLCSLTLSCIMQGIANNNQHSGSSQVFVKSQNDR